MDKVSGSIFICAAAALLLAGCQRQAPTALSKEEPRQIVVADANSIPQTSTRDPSLPDAATVFAAEESAEKAKAMQETTELQQKSAPQDDLTKEEEVKAMPLPSQANDHSTTALDKNADKNGQTSLDKNRDNNGEAALNKNGDEERGR